MEKLKGGVKNSGFYINKFYAYDRGRKVNQYIPMYKKISLANGNPVKTLKEARNIVDDWNSRIIFFKKYKTKGKVYTMLKNKGFFDIANK